jgi:hypothetical protein
MHLLRHFIMEGFKEGKKMRRLVMMMLAILMMSFGYLKEARAVDIPADAVIYPLESNLGNGLYGFFYKHPSGRMTSMTDADAFVASNQPPGAVFISTLIDYPSGSANTVDDSTLLNSFLGDDSNSLSVPGENALNGSIFVFKGFIAISNEMDSDTTDDEDDIDVAFSVGSDDGFRLRIGGVIITEHLGERGFGFSHGEASFQAEGLYEVELVYYEDENVTGVEWYSSIAGGPDFGKPGEQYQGIVPTEVLSTFEENGGEECACDLNEDGICDEEDLALLSEDYPDLNQDGVRDPEDQQIFANDWVKLHCKFGLCSCKLESEMPVLLRGDSLSFDASVTNLTDGMGRVQFGTKVRRFHSNYEKRFAWGPFSFGLAPYETKSGEKTHRIPLTAPFGIYQYTGLVRVEGLGPVAKCEFLFQVVDEAPF